MPRSLACRWTSAPATGPARALGPRQIRAESSLIRPYNMATGAAPFDTLAGGRSGRCADQHLFAGKIAAHHHGVLSNRAGCRLHPPDAGRRPHHRAAHPARHGRQTRPGGAGACGCARRCQRRHVWRAHRARHTVSPGRGRKLLDCHKVFQIGLRGSGYASDDFDWPRQQGFTLVPAHEVWYQSLAPLMAKIRAQIGTTPVLPEL